MQLRGVVVAVACTTAGALGRSDVAGMVSPVQKVLEMLTGMMEKGKQNKHEEEVAFARFTEFCRGTSAEKVRTIKATTSTIAELEVSIQKAEAEASTLKDEIAGLDQSIAGWDSDAKSAQTIRADEDAVYTATRRDYTESIHAIERAVSTLKSKSAPVPQAAVLNQLSAVAKSPAAVTRVLQSFLQESQDREAPQANAYESQSGGVIKLLEDLHERFVDELRALDTAETNRRHSHELLMQQLTDDIKYADRSRTEKSALKAGRLQSAADGKADLARAKDDKAGDEKYLSDLKANCKTKSQEYERTQATRTAEIAAIQKAIEIISSPDVAGAADKNLPALLQKRKAKTGKALVQLRASAQNPTSEAQARASLYLKQRAQEEKSPFMASLAQRVASDPFAKVTQMIKDLLTKLEEEANAEADHKGWCDAELATNQQSRDSLSSEVDRLSSKVDQLTSLEARLGQEIKDLSEALTNIAQTLSKAAATRQEEKAKNQQTIAEAKTAQGAVMNALRVLREFYGAAAQADPNYQGMQGESTGVVGMLEVVQSDFARLEAETSSAEDEAQRGYEQLVADSNEDKDVKDAERRHQTFAKDRAARDLNAAKKELEATQKELDTALEYFEKLKPSCIDSGRSYAERVAQRQAEIQSLKEALVILDQ